MMGLNRLLQLLVCTHEGSCRVRGVLCSQLSAGGPVSNNSKHGTVVVWGRFMFNLGTSRRFLHIIIAAQASHTDKLPHVPGG